MFGKIGDMMGKLQEAKQKMEETKAKLATVMITEETADIKIVLDGNRKIKTLKISEKLQQGPNAELEAQLISTFARAMENADAANEAEMKKIAMGMIPGIM